MKNAAFSCSGRCLMMRLNADSPPGRSSHDDDIAIRQKTLLRKMPMTSGIYIQLNKKYGNWRGLLLSWDLGERLSRSGRDSASD